MNRLSQTGLEARASRCCAPLRLTEEILLSNILKAPQWQTRSSWRFFQWKLATLCQWRRPKCISMPKGRVTALGRCAQRPGPPGHFAHEQMRDACACSCACRACVRAVVLTKPMEGAPRALGIGRARSGSLSAQWGGLPPGPTRSRFSSMGAQPGWCDSGIPDTAEGPASGMSWVGD